MRKFLLIALLLTMPFAVFAQDAVVEVDWTTRGFDFEGDTDTAYIISCPEDGEAYSLWGTDLYTDDSSICTVAVHMGLITLEEGGEFVMTILDGEEEYEGTEQNGISSSNWGSWERSIAVSALDDDAIEITWNTRGYDLDGDVDTTFTVSCPEEGSTGSLWGTEIYTDDSSICTVATHMGLITVEEGGEFVVTILEGQDEYEGTEQNDIESSNWGSWNRSIAVSASSNVFTSEDGTISFEYPEGWSVEEDPDGITITAEDDELPEAEILIIYLINAVAEQLGISSDDTADDAMDSITETFEENGVAFSDVEYLELGDKDVAFAMIAMGEDDLLIATIETEQGLLLAELSETDNDLEAVRADFEALIASLSTESK